MVEKKRSIIRKKSKTLKNITKTDLHILRGCEGCQYCDITKLNQEQECCTLVDGGVRLSRNGSCLVKGNLNVRYLR